MASVWINLQKGTTGVSFYANSLAQLIRFLNRYARDLNVKNVGNQSRSLSSFIDNRVDDWSTAHTADLITKRRGEGGNGKEIQAHLIPHDNIET